ncbi:MULTISPECIES: nucleotide sugar dehydrogenase [unclassified Ensifer]|uniref:nucleotide sugar dehydrogenase n=1 Tax=unclassified Ensifer TaxID=2633371 RepID=UPI0008130210|nr:MULTISPECIES: nucleotide sugar dehydrogenase [unclassified Ensifer]OCO99266.1 UDP-N-acetyl-D-glucosamine dehydrogenase [Ensifer sp. LC11]OCO99414.1 UDP-N-acetyl-D-glucosamine dehydrogenase [Ensifer sp. LC13]OCP12838.1 UDP-N-acetyl-D-glucosamine dehydrogenase [Ensifer sp. LC14]OCP29548.1 UDP-N-acetyl-D-glucosamine dehydrogenase [Ensifer sp. LC499]
MTSPHFESLLSSISARSAKVGVIGLGYVGLPLAIAAARAGFPVTGFDIDPAKIVALDAGKSYIAAVSDAALSQESAADRFRSTTDFQKLAACDVIIICVPTPLTKHRDPDLSFVEKTSRAIAATLRPAQLVVLESTTYPGTTDGVVRTILEETGLKSAAEFFVGFSPEREDPGNPVYETVSIPKVVAGDGPEAARLMETFYASVVKTVVPVSSNATAEAVKLTENIFRSVNIALVNELKIVYEAMGIDVWEVIEAAKTKPFGYMPFYPGPGLGGHCIPIDPFYLTWKSREYELPTRFIELAGEINSAMPRHVISRLAEALDRHAGKALSRSNVLVIGLAYKKNVPDIRESPSLRLIELIEERGGRTAYHDPYVAEIPPTREYGGLKGRRSVALEKSTVSAFDAVLVATDHDQVDYAALSAWAPLIVDTRNVFYRNGLSGGHIVKA